MSHEWIEYPEHNYRPSIEAEAFAKEIVDACFVIHRDVGSGFAESMYEHALAIELGLRGIPFSRQVIVPVQYRGIVIGEYRPDFVVGGLVVVELKSVRSEPVAAHVAQVLAYLGAMQLGLGFIVNFGMPSFKAGVKRVVLAPKPVFKSP